MHLSPQPAITCSKLIIEMLKQGVNHEGVILLVKVQAEVVLVSLLLTLNIPHTLL